MRWVTRRDVHLDRVASPWLIMRHIDSDAEFVFIDPADVWPPDSISFAMPGALIGIHDPEGTTFDKLMAYYGLKDPVLSDVADAVRAGVRLVLGEHLDGASESAIAIGTALAALAEGVMITHQEDDDNITTSLVIYDSLYTYFWARRRDPRRGPATFWDRIAQLRSAAPDFITTGG